MEVIHESTVPKPCRTRQTGRRCQESPLSPDVLLALLDLRRLPAPPTISVCGLLLVALALGLVVIPVDEDNFLDALGEEGTCDME